MKTDRLIAITMYLLNRETVSASALAQRFEVSKRTIQRDMDALNQAGIPIVSTHGAEGGYGIIDGFRLTKQIAGVDDALNIIVALKGLCSAYDSQRINATLEKALAALQGGQQRIFIDFAVAREGLLVDQRLRALEQAIARRQPLSIEYSNAEGVLSSRVVEPLALSYRWYAWYLFAYCTARQEYRLFKLARIVGCTPAAGAFTGEHGDVEALMKAASSGDSRKQYHILLRCKKEARQQALEYLGDNIVEEFENGDFLLRPRDVPMERMWFSLLMGFGDQVEVLQPEELRDMLAEKAREILSIYSVHP